MCARFVVMFMIRRLEILTMEWPQEQLSQMCLVTGHAQYAELTKTPSLRSRKLSAPDSQKSLLIAGCSVTLLRGCIQQVSLISLEQGMCFLKGKQ